MSNPKEFSVLTMVVVAALCIVVGVSVVIAVKTKEQNDILRGRISTLNELCSVLTVASNENAKAARTLSAFLEESEGEARLQKFLMELQIQMYADKAGIKTDLSNIDVKRSLSGEVTIKFVERTPRWFSVTATRIGLIGNKTSSGIIIKPDSVFVALPSKKALHRLVEVRRGDKVFRARVEDVGPHSTDDDYWNTLDARPKSESGERTAYLMKKYGPPKNSSGIDLSDALWSKFGVPESVGRMKVEWRFVEE